MQIDFECPNCKNSFQIDSSELAERPDALKCCLCGDTPPPDIMTAYQNVGKTMLQLQGCCDCNGKKGWLPKGLRR